MIHPLEFNKEMPVPEDIGPFRAVDVFFRTIEADPEFDDRHMMLIRLALRRALVRTEALVTVAMEKRSHRATFKAGDPVPEYCSLAVLESDVSSRVSHVIDWIYASVRNDAPWLYRTDKEGRPVKLVKLGTLDRAVAEADKAMRRFAEQMSNTTLVDGDEEMHAELGDGWRLVRLLTPKALDRESGRMQHCIGEGSYDANLAEGSSVYLSLRDPSGNPHATIEIVDGDIVQMQGKQNKRPIERYLAVMRGWLRENIVFDPQKGNDRYSWWSGRLIDIDGAAHDFDSLPDELVVSGDLDLRAGPDGALPAMLMHSHDLGSVRVDGTGKFVLPAMTKAGRLLLSNGRPTFPVGAILEAHTLMVSGCALDGLRGLETSNTIRIHIDSSTVDGLSEGIRALAVKILDSSMKALPSTGRIQDLTLGNSEIDRIPSGLEVGKLTIVGCPRVELPADMELSGLTLKGTHVTGFSPGIRIKGILKIDGRDPVVVELPEGLEVGHLDIEEWEGGQLPEGLVVRGSAKISGYRRELPETMTVRGQMTVDGRYVTHLPDGLRVGGCVIYLADDKLPTIGPDAVIGSHLLFVPKGAARSASIVMPVTELKVTRRDEGMRI